MGMVYFVIEGIWRIPSTGGYANIIMLPIGGLCGLLIGSINQFPKFYNLKIIYQSILGAIIVLIVEFISGYILNIKLGLHIWDYSNLPYNLMGQICVLYGFLWLLLIPFCIWLDDWLQIVIYAYSLYRKKYMEKPIYDYTLKSIYYELFTLK